jgi:DNA-3-methyladenine glycosylase
VAEKPNSWAFLNGLANEVAPRLLGCVLERELDGRILQARIVETEAYDQTDVASHSYKGQTPRTKVMFGHPGHLYVYFTYGMHYCCNVVVGPEGHGSAVLIRAVEPLEGENVMLSRRGRSGHELTNGPAKLCQALDIDKNLNGHDLRRKPLKLLVDSIKPDEQAVQTTRIGISEGKELPWRFYIQGNPFVSKL